MINFKDLPDTSTPINSTNLNNNFKELNNKIGNVIESGSNSNGNWVKYSDGTMICKSKKTITLIPAGNTTPQTYQIVMAAGVFIFPQVFIDIPDIMPNFTSTSIHAWLGEVGASNRDGTKGIYQIVAYGIEKTDSITMDFTYTAIGRWK